MSGAARPTFQHGAERSFAGEVDKLLLGAGETFHGEGILALAKALLEAGVAYVGGYPGAPVSHLMDVLADARERVLEPLGVQLEAAASEAGAAALLGASIHYPLRGAAIWKSIVGTNVASDALSNLASAGVLGGALIVLGEDYGEGASIIQERTHAMALKSSLPLLDPRYHLPRLVELTGQAFELSEASNLPVLLGLRIRACHMTGTFTCRANRAPAYGKRRALAGARFDFGRIVLPPSTYEQERIKAAERLPAARRFILERGINEHFPGDGGPHGIILQGGLFGGLVRALARLGLADAFGRTPLALLVLNAVHPLVPEQIEAFLAGKEAVLVVEEGQPPFIENEVRALAQRAGLTCRIDGKGPLPETGEYVTDVLRAALARWLGEVLEGERAAAVARREAAVGKALRRARAALATPVPPRPPTFCTGCPERPIFTALKLIERERGPLHVAADIGCSTFATLAPFHVGSTVLGYGMSLASSGAVGPALDAPSVAVMGDGGFWHNGLLSGAANALWNGHDAVLVILENGYAAATGQQHLPSTGSTPWGTPRRISIEETLRGLGVRWIRRVDAYRVAETAAVLREALDRRGPELRVVISDAECMLARQRRERARLPVALAAGRRVEQVRFGVDEEVCTGDHSCMRLSGCPSLTLRAPTDPLQDGPTATVDAGCLGCGLCGEVAHAARLCPSFYQARWVRNAGRWRRLRHRLAARLLGWLGA